MLKCEKLYYYCKLSGLSTGINIFGVKLSTIRNCKTVLSIGTVERSWGWYVNPAWHVLLSTWQLFMYYQSILECIAVYMQHSVKTDEDLQRPFLYQAWPFCCNCYSKYILSKENFEGAVTSIIYAMAYFNKRNLVYLYQGEFSLRQQVELIYL